MENNLNSTGASGYVYVLKNKCFKEPWLQIGHTEGPLDTELQALSYELPHDFEVVYTAESAEHEYIAERVHEALSEFRVEPERRFFLVSEQQAVESVREVLVELDDRPASTRAPDEDTAHEQDAAPIHEGGCPAQPGDAPDAVHARGDDPTELAHGDTGPETPEVAGASSETAHSPAVETDEPSVVSADADSADPTIEAASLDPYLVTDFGYLYIIKPAKRVQATARVAFGITTLGPSHLLKECRQLFDLNPRQLRLIYYGWLETSDTAERIIQMELGRFGARRKKNLFKCPLGWVADCAFQIPGLLNDYRFLRIALGRWARYYDRTPFYKTLEKRAKRGELERERQDFDVEKSVIEARLGRRVRPLVLDEYPPGWKPNKVDHGFDLVNDETHHGFEMLGL